jgi:hypothetical protein
MKKDRDAYIVIAPTGKSKIYSVACRKIGSRDRFTVIATCLSEVNADSIVDGLKLLQDEVVAIDTTTQRTLSDVRLQLTAERALVGKLRAELQNEKLEYGQKMRNLEAELRIQRAQPVAG